MSQLVEVGFANREENLRLLRKNGGDINKVPTISTKSYKCYKFYDTKSSRRLRKGTFLLSYKTTISVAVSFLFNVGKIRLTGKIPNKRSQ